MFPIFMELTIDSEIIMMSQKPEKIYHYLDSDNIFVNLESDILPPGPLYVGRSRNSGKVFHLLLRMSNSEMNWELHEYDVKNSDDLPKKSVKWFADVLNETDAIAARHHDLDSDFIVPRFEAEGGGGLDDIELDVNNFPIPLVWHTGSRKLKLRPYTGIIRTVSRKIAADVTEVADIIMN